MLRCYRIDRTKSLQVHVQSANALPRLMWHIYRSAVLFDIDNLQSSDPNLFPTTSKFLFRYSLSWLTSALNRLFWLILCANIQSHECYLQSVGSCTSYQSMYCSPNHSVRIIGKWSRICCYQPKVLGLVSVFRHKAIGLIVCSWIPPAVFVGLRCKHPKMAIYKGQLFPIVAILIVSFSLLKAIWNLWYNRSMDRRRRS